MTTPHRTSQSVASMALQQLVTLAGLLGLLGTVQTQAHARPVGASQAQQCHGTEPFWSLALSGPSLRFENLGDGTILTMPKTEARSAMGRTTDFMALYQGRVEGLPQRYLNVIIRNQTCSDGMSDETYPYSVLVLSGPQLFEGCCR